MIGSLVAQLRATRAVRGEELRPYVRRVLGRAWRPAKHLDPVLDFFERAEQEPVRGLVSMPPGHGKTITSLACMSWLMQRTPTDRHAYVAYAGKATRGKSNDLREMVLANGWQPHRDFWSLSDWRSVAGGGLLATGIGGPLTNERITGMLNVDDPFKNADAAYSEVIRDSVSGWFDSVGYTRLVPERASCVVVHTRWNLDDLIGRLRGIRLPSGVLAWEEIRLPAINDAGEALWPEMYPLEELARIKAQLDAHNPYLWPALYLQSPVPKGGKVFGRDGAEPARYLRPDLNGARIVLSVDAAGTDSTRADFTAAVALAVRGRGAEQTADVLDLLHVQKEPEQSAPLLRAFQVKWGGGTLFIEATRDGKALAKALRLIEPKIVLQGVPPVGDKFTRAQPLAAAYNSGRLRLPMTATWLFDLLQEFGSFTGLGDKHDDIVDACAQGWNKAAGGTSASGSVSI